MSKSITIIIEKDGKVTVEAHGYKGGSCTKATEPLVKGLIGAKSERDEKKPEFFQGDNAVRIAEHE